MNPKLIMVRNNRVITSPKYHQERIINKLIRSQVKRKITRNTDRFISNAATPREKHEIKVAKEVIQNLYNK